jgi:hypothetical protein
MLYQSIGCSTLSLDCAFHKVIRKWDIVLPTAFPYQLIVVTLAILACSVLIGVHLHVTLHTNTAALIEPQALPLVCIEFASSHG